MNHNSSLDITYRTQLRQTIPSEMPVPSMTTVQRAASYNANASSKNDDVQVRGADFTSRGVSLNLVPPASLPLRASSEVLLIPELRGNIARFLDADTKEVLALVSKPWHSDLQNDDDYLRRVEKILRLRPGAAATWILSARTRDMARITMNILNKKIDNRTLNEEEHLFNDFLPLGAWDEINGCLKLAKMYRGKALKNTAQAVLCIGGSVAVGFGGYRAAHWLFDHGWTETAGYAWNAARKAYEKTKPDAFYQERWVWHGDDRFWEAPPTPQDERFNRIVLCLVGASVLVLPACDQALQALRGVQSAQAVCQELRDNARARFENTSFAERAWRIEQLALEHASPWYDRWLGIYF